MNRKEIVLVSVIILLIITIVTILIYYNSILHKNSNIQTIEAEVLALGEDYILVTTSEDIDYVVNTNDLNYEIGDNLKIELKDINKNKKPIEAVSQKITKISENKEEEKKQNDNIPFQNDSTNTSVQKQSSSEPTSENVPQQTYNETEVINYFSNFDNELKTYNTEQELSQTLKSRFVQCIDFIFYDGTIYGITFNELTSKAKLKIITIALSIDNKIETNFPGYKENINNTYQNIKSKLVEKYLDITTNICASDQEMCINAKEGFKNLKDTFSITWDVIKKLAGSGTTKLKNWYEIWRYN